MCDQCDNKKGFLGGVLIGGAIASGLFFLFGTEKGKKIQKQIKEKSGEVAEDISVLVADLEEKGKEYGKRAEKVAKEVKEQLDEKVSTGSEIAKEQIAEKLDTAMTKIEEIQEHGREVTESLHEDLKKRFFKNIPKK